MKYNCDLVRGNYNEVIRKNDEVIVSDEATGKYKGIILRVSTGGKWQEMTKMPRITKMIYYTYLCVLANVHTCISK